MSERRIPPSEALAKAVETLLSGSESGSGGGELLSRLAQLGARQLVQEALEKEQAEHLERGRYERRSEGAPPIYRNGYEPGRMLIGEGEIEVLRPQVRGGSGPYRSRLVVALQPE